MSASNETAIGTQWAWVDGSQYQVFASVDELSFALCIATPKHKNNIRSLIIKGFYRGVG
jgi:hypothetical protein